LAVPPYVRKYAYNVGWTFSMRLFFVAPLIRPFAVGLVGIGRFALLLWRAFSSWDGWSLFSRNLIRHMADLGVASIPIASLAIAFSGAVITFQTKYQLLSPLLPSRVIGTVVSSSLILELGALVTAFILTARVGARIAAELGTMRVSEQIDALEVMGINAANHLIAPRVIAGMLTFPVVYVFATASGILTSAIVGDWIGALTMSEFIEGAQESFRPFDVLFSLIKSVIFGFIITSIPAYKGYYTQGGTEGVGRSTTQASVICCVSILFADYVCAALML